MFALIGSLRLRHGGAVIPKRGSAAPPNRGCPAAACAAMKPCQGHDYGGPALVPARLLTVASTLQQSAPQMRSQPWRIVHEQLRP